MGRPQKLGRVFVFRQNQGTKILQSAEVFRLMKKEIPIMRLKSIGPAGGYLLGMRHNSPSKQALPRIAGLRAPRLVDLRIPVADEKGKNGCVRSCSTQSALPFLVNS